jgi:hypothetical protein
MEEWREISGYEGIYGVSDWGRVRSRYVHGRESRIGNCWRLLKPGLDEHGRPQVVLHLHGKRTTRRVSILVADAFLPAKGPTDRVVRHLNDNPTDNRACNLARGTYSDNAQDSIHNGTFAYRNGSSHWNAKLNEEKVREIRRLYATGDFTLQELALQVGMTFSVIGKIIKRKAWKHVV